MGRNIIADAAEVLTSRMIEFGSFPARYDRDGDEVRLDAVPGRSNITLSDAEGGTRVVQWEDDWLIRVDDLALSAGRTDPLIGDTLTIESGPKAGRYEILSPGPGQRHAIRAGGGTMWRLHTKRIKDPVP